MPILLEETYYGGVSRLFDEVIRRGGRRAVRMTRDRPFRCRARNGKIVLTVSTERGLAHPGSDRDHLIRGCYFFFLGCDRFMIHALSTPLSRMLRSDEYTHLSLLLLAFVSLLYSQPAQEIQTYLPWHRPY